MTTHANKPKGRSIFSKHPFWLGNYYLVNICFYLAATLGALYWNRLFEQVSWWWVLSLIPLFLQRFRYIAAGAVILAIVCIIRFRAELSWTYFAALPVAIYLGHLSAVFIHNAVHNNFKPIWLNPIIGELCALHQISAGFLVFKYVHYEHHAYPDIPKKDPHPPKGYSFWQFVDQSRDLIISRLAAVYLESWGDTEKNRLKWRIQDGLLLMLRFTKTLFLFVLLGPKVFALLYLPSYIANVFLFAAFNYFTHVEKADGSTEILNLDNNGYFWFCNRTMFGVFYHKNHHLKAKLFNPMQMPEATQ